MYKSILLALILLVMGSGRISSVSACQTGATDQTVHNHGEHHQHLTGLQQDADDQEEIDQPTVFLDKSPRIVAYQLGRLDNQRLLLVERATDDPKYIPVYFAILTRAGMSPEQRMESLAALVELKESTRCDELLDAMKVAIDEDERLRTFRQLANLFLAIPQQELGQSFDTIELALETDSRPLRAVCFAAMVAAGRIDRSWDLAQESQPMRLGWLDSVQWIQDQQSRAFLRPQLLRQLEETQPVAIRQAAIDALSFEMSDPADTFDRVAPLVEDDELRDHAIRTLLEVPVEERSAERSANLVAYLVDAAEATPAADRTADNFIDAMQLVDQLLVSVSLDEARGYRARLAEITVRLIRIHTVEEEMRYDLKYFAVQAGQTVQIILDNEDLMPHNLVITSPGAMQEVALEGLAAGPDNGYQGKQYVPENENVLFATEMVQNGQQARLTFEAPSEPGEYPYVCTFPQHWMRMNGVMVVVEDLDAWLQNPVEPKDPTGNNRSFVQSWKLDDFQDELEVGLRGRSYEIGERLFNEATCATCHKIGGEGGQVGPDLAGIMERHEDDTFSLLRELIDPSHKIDDQYAVHYILTLDGVVVSGIIVEENDESISVLVSPDAPEPTVILVDDIDVMEKTTQSIMPKALLDNFTKDEIFEILSYLIEASEAAN